MDVIYAVTCDIGKIGIRETCVEDNKCSESNVNYESLKMLVVVNIVEMGTF